MSSLVNILYLEADFSLAQVVKTQLINEKYAIELSLEKKDFLSKLAHKSFDILIVDFLSLGSNGVGFLKYLAEQKKSDSLIVTLASGDHQLRSDALQFGCEYFVFKDVVDYSALLLLSAKHIAKNQQLRKAKEKIEKEFVRVKDVAERVQNIAKIGNWEYFPGKKIAEWSPQEFRNFGYQPDAVAPTYDKYIKAIHPDDRSIVEKRNVACIDTHETTEFVFRLLLENNEIRYIRAITESDVDQHNQVVRVFGVSQDITEQKASEARLLQAAAVYETATEAIFITDENKDIISINPAFTMITGYSEQQALGKNPSLLSSGRHNDDFFKRYWNAINRQGFWKGEIWNKRQNGEIFPCWQSVTEISDANGDPLQYVSMFIDITNRKKNEELISYQANYDSLTDLPNRNLFLDRMDNAIQQAKRSGKRVALMLLDLDRFKWVNDTLGHKAGDLVLEETAKRLKLAVRGSDTVARLGGDEFTVILPDLEKGVDAEVVASKIFASFAEPVDIEGNEIFISGSLGISVYPEDGENTEILQKNADSAMYSAKEAGRNRFHYFTHLLQAEADRRLTLISYMRRAIEREEFSVYYQPVMDIVDETIISAEALIRWKQPVLGFVSPVEFIPLAEETGLIRPIGDWVVRRVAEDMQRWQKMNLKPIQISINKSPKQFSMGGCGDDWKTILKEYGIPLSRVVVEITETVFMEKGCHSRDALANMRKMGMQVALDDFGTGYSSLSYLKRFPIDILKIDREFINDLISDSSDALLVETIITLAEKMKLKVIAEGVETEEQLSFLKKHHCRYVQGYFYSKPLPCDEFEAYVISH